MLLTDPIADMLTRIRNAIMVSAESAVVPYSKIKNQLLELMLKEGFISNFNIVKDVDFPLLKIDCRYYNDKEPAIHGLKRVSRPGLRVYVKRSNIPYYYNGMGVSFLSTSQGILTDKAARRQGVGGELLFYVW